MGRPISSAMTCDLPELSGQWKASLTYSSPCRNPQAAAT